MINLSVTNYNVTGVMAAENITSDCIAINGSNICDWENLDNLFLELDGSNANQNIDIGAFDFRTSTITTDTIRGYTSRNHYISFDDASQELTIGSIPGLKIILASNNNLHMSGDIVAGSLNASEFNNTNQTDNLFTDSDVEFGNINVINITAQNISAQYINEVYWNVTTEGDTRIITMLV